MILQCSECQARFLVPDQAIGLTGRHVRCGKCSHTWFQEASPEAEKQVLSDLDTMLDEINAQPKPMAKGSNLPKIPRDTGALLQKIAVFAVSMVAVALVLLLTAPGVLGLPHSKGLALADVGIVRQVAADKHISFQITGKIANITAVAAKAPTLRVTLVDNDGTSLQYWDFPPDGLSIEAGKSIPFATGSLDIRFAKGSRFVVELGNPLELALRRRPG